MCVLFCTQQKLSPTLKASLKFTEKLGEESSDDDCDF